MLLSSILGGCLMLAYLVFWYLFFLHIISLQLKEGLAFWNIWATGPEEEKKAGSYS